MNSRSRAGWSFFGVAALLSAAASVQAQSNLSQSGLDVTFDGNGNIASVDYLGVSYFGTGDGSFSSELTLADGTAFSWQEVETEADSTVRLFRGTAGDVTVEREFTVIGLLNEGPYQGASLGVRLKFYNSGNTDIAVVGTDLVRLGGPSAETPEWSGMEQTFSGGRYRLVGRGPDGAAFVTGTALSDNWSFEIGGLMEASSPGAGTGLRYEVDVVSGYGAGSVSGVFEYVQSYGLGGEAAIEAWAQAYGNFIGIEGGGTPVPEPGTWAAWAGAAALLVAGLRRRRR